MTVSYTAAVASCTENFGCCLKLLGRWRGSLYKLVWRDLVIFLGIYFFLSLIYRFILTDSGQRIFEKISFYCDKHGSLIPLSFVLGFYVQLVVTRWWTQFCHIPMIDTLALWVNTNVTGSGDKERLVRRTIVRYVCLSMTQCFMLISPRVKKRFPTLEHLVEAGLLLENEKNLLKELMDESHPGSKYPKYWIPFVWAAGIVTRARAESRIPGDGQSNAIINEINRVKDQCAMLLGYDWISVPLVYTQVVTLAVYSYFLAAVMGTQWLIHPDEDHQQVNFARRLLTSSSSDSRPKPEGSYNHHELDLVLPFFTILQFLFYMGWLKTAESLLNPFGDDDDDFELNWFVDRNLQVSYLIVDGMHKDPPELLKDQYWNEVLPPELPHTVASEVYREEAPVGSTAEVIVTNEQAEVITVLSPAPIPSNRESPGRATSQADLKSMVNNLDNGSLTLDIQPGNGDDSDFHSQGHIRSISLNNVVSCTRIPVEPQKEMDILAIHSPDHLETKTNRDKL